MSMNIGTAKRVIRSFSYKTGDIPELVEAAITLYDHASALEAEIDCECARWTAATASCHTRTREVLAHLTKVPDALAVIREAHKFPSQVTDPDTLAEACEIALEVEELFEVELRAVRAAWFTASDEIRKKRVGGHQLVEQVQDDGTHHIVAGVRLKSGDTLYLLTYAGWILGQYRTALDRRALFCFALPGLPGHDFGIPIVPGAIFTWPVWHHLGPIGPRSNLLRSTMVPQQIMPSASRSADRRKSTSPSCTVSCSPTVLPREYPVLAKPASNKHMEAWPCQDSHWRVGSPLLVSSTVLRTNPFAKKC